MFDEKRIFDRFSTRFPAKFKDTRHDFGTNVYLRDSSAGGAKISTKERINMYDPVALEVELPDGNSPMVLRGEVIWVKSQKYNIWDIGFKFHQIDLMHLSRLYKFVSPS